MFTGRSKIIFGLACFVLLTCSTCAGGVNGSPTPDLNTNTPPPTRTPTPLPTATPLKPIIAPPTENPNLIPATIVEVSPPTGNELLPGSTVRIRFNQPMNRKQVEAALHIDEAILGIPTWWDDTTLDIEIKDMPQKSRTVYISLADTATATSGAHLRAYSEFTYTTVSYLQIIKRSPSARSNVDPNTTIGVTFNRPVGLLEGNPVNLPAAFTLEPVVEGTGKWVNSAMYVFTPASSLRSTKYKVRLNPNLTSVEGLPWSSDATMSWDFSVRPLSILYIEPYSQKTNEIYRERKPLDIAWKVHFSDPMDIASLTDAITLQDQQKTLIPLYITCVSPQCSVVDVRPRNQLGYGQDYIFTVSKKALSSSGSPLLTGDMEKFSTMPRLRLGTHNLTRQAPGTWVLVPEYGYPHIYLGFDTLLDQSQNLYQVISITPPVKNLRLENYSTAIILYGDFENNRQYTLTVSSELRDAWGNRMQAAQQIKFLTVPRERTFAISFFNARPFLFFQPHKAYLVARGTDITRIELAQSPLSIADYLRISQQKDQQFTLESKENLIQWTQNLQLPPGESVQFEVPLSPSGGQLPPGLYYLHLRVPEARYFYWMNEYDRSFLLVVTDTHLTVKVGANGDTLIWAVDLRSNEPIPNRTVMAYDRNGLPLAEAVTDDQGLARFSINAADAFVFTLGVPGDTDFSLVMGFWSSIFYSPNEYYWNYSGDMEPSEKKERTITYVYTDRPMYQPGQEVYFRVIARTDYDGVYMLPATREVAIKLEEVFTYQKSNKTEFEPLILPLSKYGTASGSIKLPDDLPPGDYQISVEGRSAVVGIKVMKFTKPEVDLQVSCENPEIMAGEDLVINFDTRYFFGAPASNMPIKYWVFVEPENFWVHGYETGKGNHNWLLPNSYIFSASYGASHYQPRARMTGELETNAEGRVVLRIPANQFSEVWELNQPVHLEIQASLAGESINPVTASTSAIIHSGPFYVAMRLEQWTTRAGNPVDVHLLTADWKSQPQSKNLIRVELNKLEVIAGKNWRDYAIKVSPVSTRWIRTDENGLGSVRLVPPTAGLYIVRASGLNTVTETYLYVLGPQGNPWPRRPDYKLDMFADASLYHPGDTARIIITNPFYGKTQALITVERENVRRVEVITLSSSGYEYSLPISMDDAPNIYVSVLLLNVSASGKPDFRTGSVNLVVEREVFGLQLEMIPDPEVGKPGGAMSLTILVKDWFGNPVQGEFSLALIDKAILALKHPYEEPVLEYFYPDRPKSVVTGFNMAIYGRYGVTEDEELYVMRDFLGGGYGGGGEEIPPSDLRLRQNYQDLAYWNGIIETDAEGKARISFVLPDNITTWVARVRGISMDSKVGEATCEFAVRQDLMVYPQVPRFLIEGDHIQLAALVYNHSSQSMQTHVALQSTGITLDDPAQATQIYTIPAGEKIKVTWWATVNPESEADLLFSVWSGEASDSTRPEWGTIPIQRQGTEQGSQLTGGIFEEGFRLEAIDLPPSFDPTGGTLTIELSSSLYPLVNRLLEQLTSSIGESGYKETDAGYLFAEMELWKTGKRLKLFTAQQEDGIKDRLQKEVTRMTNQQNNMDGSWGLRYQGESGDPFQTATALIILHRASEAGLKILSMDIKQAQTYLEKKMFSMDGRIKPDLSLDEQALILYALQISGKGDQQANLWLYDRRYELSAGGKALLALTLAKSSPQNVRTQVLLKDINETAIHSYSGVYWQGEPVAKTLFAREGFNTTCVLFALSELDPSSPLIQPVVIYLINKTSAFHASESDMVASWALAAIVNTMTEVASVEADFSYAIRINDEEVASGSMAGSSSPLITIEIPLDEIKIGETNVIDLSRLAGKGQLYYTIRMEYNPAAQPAAQSHRSMTLKRWYFPAGKGCTLQDCKSLEKANLSDTDNLIEVHLQVAFFPDKNGVIIEDYFPAGMEFLDQTLNLPPQTGDEPMGQPLYGGRINYGWGTWLLEEPEIFPGHVRWNAVRLPPGVYELVYFLRPKYAGEFFVPPARMRVMLPEGEGASTGMIFTIEE